MNRVLLTGVIISTIEQQAGQKTCLVLRLSVTERFKSGGESRTFPIELKAFRDIEIIKGFRAGTLVEIQARVSGHEAGEGKYAGRVFQDLLIDLIQEV